MQKPFSNRQFPKIAVLFFLFVFISFLAKSQPKAHKGVLDLRNYSATDSEQIELQGEWKFYWKVFSERGEIPQCDSVLLLNVPAPWPKYLSEKAPFGTYHLQILFDANKKNRPLKLKLGNFHRAMTVWVNKKLITSYGQLSHNAENEIPGAPDYLSIFATSVAQTDTVDILISLSAHALAWQYRGLIAVPAIGTEAVITEKTSLRILLHALIVGLFITIGVYHLILFFVNKTEIAYLLFALTALFFAIRTSHTFYFLHQIAVWNYDLGWKISYVTLPAYPMLMYAFFWKLFPQDFSKKISRGVLITGSIFIGSVILGNSDFISKTDLYIGLFALVTESLMFYGSIRAMLNKRLGAQWAFVGAFIFILTTINDVLYALRLLDTIFLTHYGMALYTVFQALNLAQSFSTTFNNNKKLTQKLDYQNKNLNQIVRERTIEIERQNRQINSKAYELAFINEELRDKQEEILKQAEELNRKSNQLHKYNKELESQRRYILGSITYAKNIQNAILPLQETCNQFFNSFVIYLPKDIVSGDFYWFTYLKPQQICFAVVADCTGHGVPGAFMSMIGSRILGEIINSEAVTETDQILEELNNRIYEALHQENSNTDDGMDMVLCKMQPHGNDIKIQYSGAKRPLFYVDKKVNNAPIQIIKADRKSIGGKRSQDTSMQFTATELILAPNDYIYLTTDGFIDQNNSHRKRFGTQKLLNILHAIHGYDLEIQDHILRNKLQDHQGNEPQRDDITIWGIELKELVF